jgi:glycine dehydrogenase subunit 1
LREVAELCVRRSHYAAERIAAGRMALQFDRPFFKEFTVRARGGRVSEALAVAEEAGFLAGVPLERWYPELRDCFLVAVTEKRTRKEIDVLAESFARAG